MAEPRATVLIVEDSPETLGMLHTALEEAGYAVLVALSGDQALAVAAQVTPDVVLMDAVLPGIDGFATTRRLLRLPGAGAVPVIFMTGLTETGHVVEGLGAGGVDYVTKPVVVPELLARIDRHLATARLTRAAQEAADAAGSFLLAADPDGRLRWATPQAARLLAGCGGGLPEPVRRWLRSGPAQPLEVENGEETLVFSPIGRGGAAEILLRIARRRGARPEAALRDGLGVTPREAEVLFWLARGKSNRDIAAILSLSPRTVNKHLEQIYAKLGVENRASAVALSIRKLEAG